jgi:hypothetical protein
MYCSAVIRLCCVVPHAPMFLLQPGKHDTYVRPLYIRGYAPILWTDFDYAVELGCKVTKVTEDFVSL